MTKEKKELLEFKVLYGNSDQEIIESETILTAQLEAHKRAIVKKTIVISVEKKELLEFKVLYGNSDQEIIESETILTAQLEAHKRAIVKKTIVISVKLL